MTERIVDDYPAFSDKHMGHFKRDLENQIHQPTSKHACKASLDPIFAGCLGKSKLSSATVDGKFLISSGINDLSTGTGFTATVQVFFWSVHTFQKDLLV